MNELAYNYIGKGIYSIKEAERLTQVPSSKIRRWLTGYKYDYKGKSKHTDAIIGAGFDNTQDIQTITFADLIEIRFINAFRTYGISWKTIRKAALKAEKILSKTHPFSSQRFKTDGRTILLELIDEQQYRDLIDLANNQCVFEKVIAPYLYEGLDFNLVDEPERWWPLGKKRSVVIDPQRSFGAPIVTKGGVPTTLIYKAMLNENSIESVSYWLDIDAAEVVDAVEYEKGLAA